MEVYRGDEVKLAIVVGTPLTTEWIWERNQAAKDKRGLDELPYDETDSSRHPKSRITSLMSRLQPNVPSVIPTP